MVIHPGDGQTVCVAVDGRLTGSKNPSHLCPGGGWNWSAFDAVAEFLEFPDHARGARALGLGTHGGSPFLVADPLVED